MIRISRINATQTSRHQDAGKACGPRECICRLLYNSRGEW